MKYLVLLCLLSSLTVGQDVETHQHATSDDTNTEELIDGAAHPELIPESTAYRLWFSAIARGDSDENRSLRNAQLAELELNKEDTEVLVGALETFNIRFDAMVKEQNEEATKAAESQSLPNDEEFFLRRDSMVDLLVGGLKDKMSEAAFLRLGQLIQSEKKNMRISRIAR